MSQTVQAIRGMNDILPDKTPLWQRLEQLIRDTVASYGYQEIRMPVVEKTELFKRSIGEVTDIVEKEMYTFEDRSGDSLTLRPEGTAGCVRAGIEHGLLYNQVQRFWYIGAMFRHERPQLGRTRQFHQAGVEAFGMQGPDIDVELIAMSARLWQQLNLQDMVTLQINSLGSVASRALYREQLVAYFQQYIEILDEDCKRRLHKNPLRILDSKNPALVDIIKNAPRLIDSLDENAKRHFDDLLLLLDALHIKYQVNTQLVRGLDYYNYTVFEWVTDKLGAQGTVCAGGRYDGLVELLGGKPTPAVGFAMGLERIVALMELQENARMLEKNLCIYIIVEGAVDKKFLLMLAEKLRVNASTPCVELDCSGSSFKSQFKRACKSDANIAVIVEEENYKRNMVTVKYLQQELPQETVKIEALLETVIPRLDNEIQKMRKHARAMMNKDKVRRAL